jgi:hypothetical protein
MPAILACAACQTKLKVPENSAPKALRCPKCKAVVPHAPPKPPPPEEEEFEVNEAADEKEEEFEVNEAVAEKEESKANKVAEDEVEDEASAEPDEDTALAELQFLKVKDVFKKGNIPDDARKAIEKTFVKNEKALWAGRPSEEIIASKSWLGLVVGPIFGLLGVSICLGMGAFSFLTSDLAVRIIAGITGAIFGIMFLGGGILMLLFRRRMGGNAAACYVVTNKRAYIFEGSVRAFSSAQLQKMSVEPSSKFDGAGDLVFAFERQYHQGGEHRTNIGFLNIEKVRTVKKFIEEVLLEPALAKMKSKTSSGQKNKKLFG